MSHLNYLKNLITMLQTNLNVVVLVLLSLDQTLAEVIKPLQYLSIPDADFAPSHEFNGKSFIQ